MKHLRSIYTTLVLLLSLVIVNNAFELTVQQKEDAKNIIKTQFKSGDYIHKWTKENSDKYDYDRYECEKVYCTNAGQDCWHISIHVHAEKFKKLDKIYAFLWKNGDSSKGNSQRIGKWDYDLVAKDSIQRRCKNYCQTFGWNEDKQVIIQHAGENKNTLRIDPKVNTELDTWGGLGSWAKWTAKPNKKDGKQYVKIQSKKTEGWIRIEKDGDNYIANAKGSGGKYTLFQVHELSDGAVKLESVEFPDHWLCVIADTNEVVVGDSGGPQCKLTVWEYNTDEASSSDQDSSR